MAIWGCLPCLVCQELSWAAMGRKERKQSWGGGWGETTIPNLLHKAPEKPEWGKRKMWLRKKDFLGVSKKHKEMIADWKKRLNCFTSMWDKQTYNLVCGMSLSGAVNKKANCALKRAKTHRISCSNLNFLIKRAQSQILSQVIINSWQ